MTKINAKDAIEKIRKLLFTESSNSQSDPAQTSYNLKDGTPIKVVGNLAAGSAVLVSGTDGDTPAPDGELELSDGTVISVTGGLITEIETAGQAIDEQNGGDAPDESQFKAISGLQNKIAEIENKINAFRESFGKQAIAQKELLDLVTVLAELPANEPASKPKNAFSEIRSRQDAKMRHLASSLQKLKKIS